MNQFKYYNPVQIQFGREYLKRLPHVLGERKALLLTSAGFTKRGVVDQVKALTNQIVQVVDSVPPNPTFNDLARLYAEVKHDEIEAIVALGGGSVIDSAKVLAVHHPTPSFDKVTQLIKEGDGEAYQFHPIIAIPTTSGTSSEITPWATVWDTEEKKKYSLHLKDSWCETALYDPVLTLTLPQAITIQTGLDALSHSFESLWNKNANLISRDHAVAAIKEILEVLPRLSADLSNLDLRERLMYASVKAGLAFSNTQTSIAHAISYYLTLHKEVPHGIACSITLPTIADVVKGQSKEIDAAFQFIFGQADPLDVLERFFSQLGVSTRLGDYHVEKTDLDQIKASLANNQRAGNSVVDTEQLFDRLAAKL